VIGVVVYRRRRSNNFVPISRDYYSKPSTGIFFENEPTNLELEVTQPNKNEIPYETEPPRVVPLLPPSMPLPERPPPQYTPNPDRVARQSVKIPPRVNVPKPKPNLNQIRPGMPKPPVVPSPPQSNDVDGPPKPPARKQLPPAPKPTAKPLPPTPKPSGKPLPKPPANNNNADPKRGPLPPTPKAKAKARPLSVHKPTTVNAEIGTDCLAKYSEDGEFYTAIIEDFKNGHYLVSFPEYDDFQEWVKPSDIKKN